MIKKLVQRYKHSKQFDRQVVTFLKSFLGSICRSSFGLNTPQQTLLPWLECDPGTLDWSWSPGTSSQWRTGHWSGWPRPPRRCHSTNMNDSLYFLLRLQKELYVNYALISFHFENRKRKYLFPDRTSNLSSTRTTEMTLLSSSSWVAEEGSKTRSEVINFPSIFLRLSVELLITGPIIFLTVLLRALSLFTTTTSRQ